MHHYKNLHDLKCNDALKRRVEKETRMKVWKEYEKFSKDIRYSKELIPIVTKDTWGCIVILILIE